MIKIYGSNLSSPANKVRFVANALGIDYSYEQVNLMAGDNKSEEYLKLHPAGKVPVIDDNGFILFESSAIIKYLAEKQNSPYYPKDGQLRALVDQWIDFGSLHIGPAMGKVVFNRLYAPLMKMEVDERSLAEGLAFLERFLPVVDRQLQKNSYLAGPRITLADFNLLAVMDPAEAGQIDLSGYPALVAWRNTLRKEDFYTRCHKNFEEAVKALSEKI